MEKDTESKNHDHCAVEPIDQANDDTTQPSSRKKPLSFYISMLMLSMIALIVSWDVTALSLALPVQ
jgi:hypothetical protein